MAWFRRTAKLTGARADELNVAFDRLNDLVAQAQAMWPKVHAATKDLHTAAQNSMANGWDALPLSPELLPLAKTGHRELIWFSSRLQQLRDEFAAVRLPEWAPAKARKLHQETLDMFFDGQIGFLTGPIQALAEPDPLVHTGPGMHKPNMLHSGLNLVAQMAMTARPFSL